MLDRLRILGLVLLINAGSTSFSRPQIAPAPPPHPNPALQDFLEDPELQSILEDPALRGLLEDPALELPPPPPLWSRFYTARAGAGYKNNVLLSKFNRQKSSFAVTGLEFFASRLPDEGGETTLFVSAEDRRFLDSVDIDHEQLVFAQFHHKTDLDALLRFSFPAEYVYQNQVVDVSVSERDLDILKVRGHSLILHPGLRLQHQGPWHSELQFSTERQWLESPLDHYWEVGPLLQSGRAYGHGSELQLGYEFKFRGYDHENALDEDGFDLRGTSRALTRHEFLGEWRHVWDAGKRWRSTTRASLRLNRDNGGGYLDYDRYQAFHQGRFRRDPWMLLAEVRLYYYHYLHQTVSETDLDKRDRTELSFRARAERKLYKGLHAYAEYLRERVRSNLNLEEYDVETVMAGLFWDF